MIDVGDLYEQHRRGIFAYLQRRCGDPELAEDLTQETFRKAHERAGSYVDRGRPPSAWLYRIAHNALVDHMRVRKTAHSLDLVPTVAAVTSDAGNERQVQQLEIESLLARLPEKQQAVIRSRFLKGLPIREAAAAVGVSQAAAKKLQQRGLVAMRRMMEAA